MPVSSEIVTTSIIVKAISCFSCTDNSDEHAEELAEKSARLEQLNRELEVGQADEVIMNESEDEVQDGSRLQDAPTKTEEIAKPSPKLKL